MCILEILGSVYILTLTENDEHHLTLSLIEFISDALQRIQCNTAAHTFLFCYPYHYWCKHVFMYWGRHAIDYIE